LTGKREVTEPSRVVDIAIKRKGKAYFSLLLGTDLANLKGNPPKREGIQKRDLGRKKGGVST